MSDAFVATVEVPNRLGLHARAAAKLVHVANRYEAEIQVSKDEQVADAKSIMGVLLLCGQRGARLTIRAIGADAEAALEALCDLVTSGFGETQ
ncbi:MAG: HPr family phosphocarrier protein [Myxococcales bacterium]|nr:HPr family phosphocarrier protein [Myxococcales bacterium]MDH3845638.1 HPr family phosphocarrier protein [Myxococcales bacterium]